MIISTAKAPVRIDFAGAWTDVPCFSTVFGGATCNAAINHFVSGQRFEKEQLFHTSREVQSGITVSHQSSIPIGSGLGTSSAANVVWLALNSDDAIETPAQRSALAEKAWQAETTLGIVGGKQDHYAGAHGGFHLYEFGWHKTTIHPIKMPAPQIAELESLCTLCYTGQSRLSSMLHQRVWQRFQDGNVEVLEALFGLTESACKARELLEAGNWEQFGKLLSEQHQYAKMLDRSLSNPQIESILEMVAPHTSGAKCCGAGGGGCMIFISPTPQHQTQCQELLQQNGMQIIPFRFEMNGLTIRH